MTLGSGMVGRGGLGLGGYSESLALCETERQEESQGFDSAEVEVGWGGGGGGERSPLGHAWGTVVFTVDNCRFPPPTPHPPGSLGRKDQMDQDSTWSGNAPCVYIWSPCRISPPVHSTFRRKPFTWAWLGGWGWNLFWQERAWRTAF